MMNNDEILNWINENVCSRGMLSLVSIKEVVDELFLICNSDNIKLSGKNISLILDYVEVMNQSYSDSINKLFMLYDYKWCYEIQGYICEYPDMIYFAFKHSNKKDLFFDYINFKQVTEVVRQHKLLDLLSLEEIGLLFQDKSKFMDTIGSDYSGDGTMYWNYDTLFDINKGTYLFNNYSNLFYFNKLFFKRLKDENHKFKKYDKKKLIDIFNAMSNMFNDKEKKELLVYLI